MVSADHFAQELREQMSRAAKAGSMDIVIIRAIASISRWLPRLYARDACML
jgi:hypothetical protein